MRSRFLHPSYSKNKKRWKFFLDSYVGGDEWLTSDNMFKFGREDANDYKTRIGRAAYFNYCRPVIDTYTAFIFGADQRVTRDLKDPGWDTFAKDVDLRGNPIDDFMQDISMWGQMQGHVGILVDQPQKDDKIITLADVREAGLRTFLTIYPALSIVDWSLDRFGAFKWVRLAESERNDADPMNTTQRPTALYRVWTRDKWFIHDEDAKVIAGADHSLGVVPFIMHYFDRHPTSNLIGIGILQDIARINRMMVNVISYIDEFVAKQAFPFLAEEEAEAVQPEEARQISANNVYGYPEGTHPPQYISPPIDPAEFMKVYVQDFLTRQIFRLAKLETRVLMEQSGVAKQMDFMETDAALTRYARRLERTEESIQRVWGLWEGRQVEPMVDYPDSYDIGTLEETLKNALDVVALYTDQSPTMISEHLKTVATRLQPKMEEDVRKVIDGELEEAVVVEQQAAAFDRAIRDAA